MANNKIKVLLLFSCICLISSRLFSCPETKEPPETLDNPNFSFKPVSFNGLSLNPLIISDLVLVNPQNDYVQSIKDYLTDSQYCPSEYVIVKKEDLEAIISNLGDNAYSTFTDKNGLAMSEGIYYNTNTKGNGDYNKIFMILKDGEIKFEDFDPVDYVLDIFRTQKFHTICKLDIPKIEINLPEDKRDFDYNSEIEITVNNYDYFIAYLWKVNDEIIKDKNAKLKLTESGVNNVEFWGKLVSGKTEYLCEIFYVGNQKISDEIEFDESKIKKITTDFKMEYKGAVTFTTSNSPVAPRKMEVIILLYRKQIKYYIFYYLIKMII